VKYLPDDAHAGGGEVTVWNTITGLASRGHKVHAIVCKQDNNLPEIQNVEYHIVPEYMSRRPLDFRAAANWLRKSSEVKPDVVHSFYAESFRVNAESRRRGIPVVQEIHYADLYPYTLRDVLEYPKKTGGILWAAHLRYAKAAAKTADAVITPSNYMKEKLVRVFGLPDEKVFVIPVGVNEDVFAVKRKEREKDGQIRLLFVGRLVREKGLDVLLKALKKVLQKRPKTHLTIIGEGPLKNEYKRLAENLGITKNITFVGWIQREKILAYFSESDLLAVPSLKENFPRITLEAMGAGLPVIASSVGGVSEQITDGVDGILFKAGDLEDLARKLEDMTENQRRMNAIAEKARKRANEFTIKQSILRFEKLYDRLMAARD
jgi:glycosyltransferase involved in cell wall biosynthesis